MKTVTLSEEAYRRLAAWKDAELDSFSKVVLAKVPKKGTLGDLAAELDRLAPLSDADAQAVEDAVAWTNDWANQRDPWTTS